MILNKLLQSFSDSFDLINGQVQPLIGLQDDNTPNTVSDAVKMVERHIVMPSQLTAYKIGMLKILELRAMAKTKLGDKFDLREFHDEILKYGPLPLNLVKAKINDWIAVS